MKTRTVVLKSKSQQTKTTFVQRPHKLLDHLKDFAFEVISQLFDVLLVVFEQLFAVDLFDLVHIGCAR